MQTTVGPAEQSQRVTETVHPLGAYRNFEEGIGLPKERVISEGLL